MFRLTTTASRLPRRIGLRNHLSFSTTQRVDNHDETLKNLKIGSHARVIFQGFTGKQATANATESIAWGTNIVGGVTPGREGTHLDRPVLPSVRKAMEVLKPDATGIYVAAHQATAAIEEAIEAEVPLVVAVAEHIPLHDMLRIHSILKTQSKSRLVGANSPGIISATGKCRIGFQPLPCFRPGKIGIVARSGTLSYETAASTLRAGLGQSLCIGVGGDVLPGTSLLDGLKVLVEDRDTEAIALAGEIGGNMEMEAAEWIKEYNTRTKNPKPIVAIIGGLNAPPGRIMGHAGAFTLPGEASPQAKIEALKEAGITLINHPSRFGTALKSLLEGTTPTGTGIVSPRGPNGASAFQSRGYHTFARRPRLSQQAPNLSTQKRTLYLTGQTALDLLKQRGILTADKEKAGPPSSQRQVAVTINRTTRSPTVIVSVPGEANSESFHDFAYSQDSPRANLPVSSVADSLAFQHCTPESLQALLSELVALFTGKEAFLLQTTVSETSDGKAAVTAAHLGFDDAAFRSCKRQADIHALRDLSAEDADEVGVEKDGIVYVKLPGAHNNIGTLVNGAGLAMNTVDALRDAGGLAANFLDTGGKATSETVKRSFAVVLTDPRVRCVLVNIFGGLTLGDMIARGVVLAFRDLEMTVPVVVRIRGTNEEEGQRIIRESGLPLFAYDDFDEAAAKAIELANGK